MPTPKLFLGFYKSLPSLEGIRIVRNAQCPCVRPPLLPDSFKKSVETVPARSEFEQTLDMYNIVKLRESRDKYKTGERVFQNWDMRYGAIGADGSYSAAIERIVSSGAIEKYITTRFPNIHSKESIDKIKARLIDYLKNNMDIYTYPRIRGILSTFDAEISQKLKDGAVIYVPNKLKSYALITELYKEMNPKAKVLTGYNEELLPYLKQHNNAKIIVLDDCLVSGSSASGLSKTLKDAQKQIGKKIDSVDLYLLTAYEEGLKKVPKDINVHYFGEPRKQLTSSAYFRNLSNTDKGIVASSLGNAHSKYKAQSCVMFPYMSPNNNSLFGAQMIKEIFSGPECAIKGAFTEVSADEKTAESILRALLQKEALKSNIS